MPNINIPAGYSVSVTADFRDVNNQPGVFVPPVEWVVADPAKVVVSPDPAHPLNSQKKIFSVPAGEASGQWIAFSATAQTQNGPVQLGGNVVTNFPELPPVGGEIISGEIYVTE